MAETNKWYWVLGDISAKNAGLQVRTKPIINELQKLLCAVSIISIDSVVKMLIDRNIPQDAIGFIFAKPINSQAALLMTELKKNGYPVIIDIFDNYVAFSKWSYQTGIPYLWRQTLDIADAVIVSSPVIEERVRYIKPSATLLRVCDPLPWSSYSETLQNGLKKWQGRPLKRKLLWFGIGSNPLYQLGLIDLVRLLPLIKQMDAARPTEIAIELVICSNLVENVLDVLMQYQQAGIQTRFVTWSKESCDTELATTHCVLLPTGRGEFSRSKTHNRLSEAINHHCVVFTTDIGPYEDFIGGAVQSTLKGIQELLFYSDVSIINNAFKETVSNLEKHHPFKEQVGVLAKQLGVIKDIINSISVQHPIKLPPTKFVLMGFQAQGTIAKIGRKSHYVIVGYSFNQVEITYDIYLKSVEFNSGIALITCTTLGKTTLESMGYGLTQMGENNLFSLLLPDECIDNCNKLFLYYQLNASHKSNLIPISLLSVSILITLFGGKKNEFFLADDSGICWPSYIKLYADYLIKPIQKLDYMWKKTYEI